MDNLALQYTCMAASQRIRTRGSMKKSLKYLRSLLRDNIDPQGTFVVSIVHCTLKYFYFTLYTRNL